MPVAAEDLYSDSSINVLDDMYINEFLFVDEVLG